MPEVPRFILERARANAGLFTADEVAAWPAGLLDQLVGTGVLRAEQPAKTVTCDSCGDDHVEVVQYIQSPPGTALRAYIPCPQLGRAFIPAARLRRWRVDMSMIMPEPTATAWKAKIVGVEPSDPPAMHRAKTALKSWTQPDLNAAIREYKAKRAPTYGDLVEGVKAGRPGAKKAAQKIFGRNAVARELGVKSRAMVSKSPDWQAIAEELRLSRGKDRNRNRGQRIGLDIALETHATETSQPALDAAVQRETIRQIQSSMPKVQAEGLIEKLQRGEITDDQARAIVEAVKEQKRDARTQKVRGNP